MKTIGRIVDGREVYHIADDQSVREAARYMTERRVGAVAVLSGDRLAGILSERDIMGRVVARGLDLDQTRVGEVMTRDLVRCHLDDSVEHAMGLVTEHRVRHLPVMDGSQVAGMISIGDLVKATLDEARDENHHLKEYITAR